MSFRSFTSWWATVEKAWRKRGTTEGKKLLKELSSQVRKMLVGAFLALLLVFLGFPKLSAWYEAYKRKQLQPSRKVYLCVHILEEFTLQPLDKVYVQVVGDQNATAYSKENGYCLIPYVAEQGENYVKLTFTHSGYEDDHRSKFALPENEGDTTFCAPVQLSRETAQKTDATNNNNTIFN